jgi:hypothetical protein
MEANKHLCEYIIIHNSNLSFNEKYKKLKDDEFEMLYGNVEPIKEAAYIHLFYECERVTMGDGSVMYCFPNQMALHRCMRALLLGKVPFTRIGWTDIQV